MSGACSAHFWYDRECPRCQTGKPEWVVNLEAALAQAEERAALADVAEAFAQQLALKSVNHGPYNVVWNGDYDSINDNSLRELVRNYLWARLKVRGEADFDALTHIEGGKEEMKWPVKP